MATDADSNAVSSPKPRLVDTWRKGVCQALAERVDGTPVTDRGFEHAPSLAGAAASLRYLSRTRGARSISQP
jgi:hypothetical protein